ncbi:MAG: succinate CoA transferase [Planctomycetota bacterium]
MPRHNFPVLSAEEAADLIPNDAFIGFSAFTPAGAAKAVPAALAERAERMHAAGEPMRIRLIAGASTGPDIDERLAQAEAIAWRAPYQSSKTLRSQINEQRTQFVEMHLSHVGQMMHFGFLPPPDIAVVEAVDVTTDGRVFLSTSSGASPSMLRHASKVIVEVNRQHSKRLAEMHDVVVLPVPPHRSPIPVAHALSKIGTPFVPIDPNKILGVVETEAPDGVPPAREPDDLSRSIAGHIVDFLLAELRAGRIPPDFLPLQAGVGNVANAVMSGLGEAAEVPPFTMYTEVFQDSQLDLMRSGKLTGASTSALTLSDANMKSVYDDMDFFAPRLVIRPTEISNNPGVIRRLGVIAINTVLEMDIYGCANSTHVCGTQLMNGIGGSGDFVRNAYLSILVAPSIAKNGAISAVVPMCSHVDHNEHSVQVLVTEHGLADLRGLGPVERSDAIIDKCAHPSYRPYLHQYVEQARMGHIRHDLQRVFELHNNFLEHGSMLPGVEVGATSA